MLDGREDIVLVRSGTNLGFAGGNNLAARHAHGRYLLLLNDDSTVVGGCVERLLATAEADPNIGAVGCRILSADGSVQEAGSVLWQRRVGYPRRCRSTRRHRPLRLCTATSTTPRPTASGAHGRLEGGGGLDERYFPAYFEDADLA